MERVITPHEAKMLGINWLYANGKKANANAGRELLTVSPFASRGPIKSIRIRRKYNLGNHIRQVCNAVRFAELNGIKHVILPEGSPFRGGTVRGVQLSPRTKAASRDKMLVGDFFYYEEIGVSEELLERGKVLSELKTLIPRLERSLSVRGAITIHLRAGDAFSKNPHPLYAPPPLSFFTSSIEHSMASAVRVVAQDVAHPYVKDIQSYCFEHSIPITLHSSSLSEDFDMLMSSEILCIAQGTLALGAAWLSPSCKHLYGFNRNRFDLQTCHELGIVTHNAQADLPFSAWTGAESELAALASLPASKLRWN